MTGTDFLALLISSLHGLSKKDRADILKLLFENSNNAVSDRYDAVKTARQLFCLSENIINQAADEAENILDECGKAGIRIVSFLNPEYPPLLREIYSPPSVLFVKGVLPDAERPSVSIVGTRDAMRKTLSASYNAAFYLAERKINIISGLAAGIDSKAHKGAVDAGGITAAVLGTGADIIYPSSNTYLAEKILEKGGALISEYRPGTEALKYHFPERNRIISGMSRGTLLVHAPEKSGSLITAVFALEQGRDVFVHTEGLECESGKGGLELYENGAAAVSDGEGILTEWGINHIEPENAIKYRLNNLKYNVSENNYRNTELYSVYNRRKIYA